MWIRFSIYMVCLRSGNASPCDGSCQQRRTTRATLIRTRSSLYPSPDTGPNRADGDRPGCPGRPLLRVRQAGFASRRRPTAPSTPKPAISRASVAGSGTAVTVVITEPVLLFASLSTNESPVSSSAAGASGRRMSLPPYAVLFSLAKTSNVRRLGYCPLPAAALTPRRPCGCRNGAAAGFVSVCWTPIGN